MANTPTHTTPPFVHLHLHSEYSLLDGGNRMDRLIERVKELGMDSVAVTDHGNLFGAISFYTKAKKAGIKPILGIEAYVAPDINGLKGDRKDRTFTGVSDGGFHLVLLAENQTGWQHLLKLSSDAYINGFYFKPRMDKSTLAQWSEGLIAINGHLGSSLAYYLTRYETSHDEKDYLQAVKEAKWHAQTFGKNADGKPNFYIELQKHDADLQLAINPHLQRLAKELDLPLVCDNDAHFLLEEDYDAHDTLCCISMGKVKEDANRFHYPRDLYVKSAQQMAELFSDVPEAIANTQAIADRCHVEIDFSQNHAPIVKIQKTDIADLVKKAGQPEGSTAWYNAFCGQYELLPFDKEKDTLDQSQLKAQSDIALRQLTEAGAIWRYGREGITQEINDRIDTELNILADKSISAYFLIVWDFVNEARRRSIPCNARGSAVGTMVGYCLGLSNACPVEFGLLFERFTDPDRSEYPDIDIDICQNGRQAIIDYVRQKYGHVAQIITFGTLKARAVIRDVCRVLDVPLSQVDTFCKLIGDGLGTTLQQAWDQEEELQKLCDDNPLYRKMFDTALRLEGMARHAGVHAAGVVVATEPLDNLIPLYQPAGTNQIVTQWDGPTVEKIGLLKMDFLGLRTLSIIERARQLIQESLSPQTIVQTVQVDNTPGPGTTSGTTSGTEAKEQTATNTVPNADPLDMDRLDYDNQRVLDIFRRGETAGIFQFESGGMRNTLLGMKPDRLEDLIAANALFRPGPMDLIPDYIQRKHGKQAVPVVHDIVDHYTRDTFGIMVYQEQVMQIVHSLGDIPLRSAYSLIKAISKKKSDVIDSVRPKFVQGAADKGLTHEKASELFDLILKFAGYGFNKSHSTGYAIVAYQTAYLKTYFPIAYMAALLTYESVSTDKVVEYIDECKRVLLPSGKRGIEVRPPDINLSKVAFGVVFDEDETHDASSGHIRFGLSAVKGVGEKAIDVIMQARQKDGPFSSLYDFTERVSLSAVNRSTIEALIKCGAFDSVHGQAYRAAMLAAMDAAIQSGQRAASDRDSGQMNFFDSFAGGDDEKEEEQSPVLQLPSVPGWQMVEQLKHEKAVLGFYISSHPRDEHREVLDRFSNCTVEQVKTLAADVNVIVGGMFTRVRPTVVKNGRSAGQKMAMFSIEDDTGVIEGVIFSDTFAQYQPMIELDRIVFLKGKVDRRREEPNLVVNQVICIEQAAQQLTEQVSIQIGDFPTSGQPLLVNPIAAPDTPDTPDTPAASDSPDKTFVNGELEKLKSLLQTTPSRSDGQGGRGGGTGGAGGTGGGALVCVQVHQAGCVVTLRLEGLRVGVSADLCSRVDTLLHAPGCCKLVGPRRLIGKTETLASQQYDPNAPAQDKLASASRQVETCDSISRY